MTIDDALRLAMAHHQSGRIGEAERLYRQILAHAPRHAEAIHLLGVVAHQVGQHQVAIDLISQSLTITPDQPTALSNLGEALRTLGRLDEAEQCYRRSIELKPDDPQPHNNLSCTLASLGRPDEAAAAAERALALAPRHTAAHCNLGIARLWQGRFEDAMVLYREAIALSPDMPQAHCGLGLTFYRLGRLEEALAAFDEAIRLAPEYADAHFNRALVLLAQGDFSRGWAEYEWRLKVDDAARPIDAFPQPRWDGGDLAGRTLLLHAEQGFGDTIQFVRYAALLAGRGERVVLAVPRELKELVQGIEGVERVCGPGEPLPPFDVHLPMGSLPLVMGTTLDRVPTAVPYLRADAARIDSWRERVGRSAEGAKLKVGLAWAGNPRNPMDGARSCSLRSLAPLGRVEGVVFFSIQKGPAALEASEVPEGMRLIDLTAEMADFAETAALMAQLDLVITVETAVAHLGGAVGRPTWTLLPFAADWRWLGRERCDSPWYPTMRLIRQERAEDWGGVVDTVARELAGMAAR